MRCKLITILLLCSVCLMAQNDKAAYQQRLHDIHQQFVRAAKEKNPSLILEYYSDQTLFIPEFHPLILGKENIEKYYTTIYDRQTIKSYQRATKDLVYFADRLVEWGTFTLSFSQKGSDDYSLVGKFMNVWKLLENNELELVSEQWNYDHKIDPAIQLTVDVEGKPLRYKTPAAQSISVAQKHELNAYYALGARAVENRDPYGRLNAFAPNGVFLAPHGETAKIGFDALKEYLVDYNGGEVIIDSLDVGYNHVEDYGEFLIKNNYYYVEASGDGWTHRGQGLGTDLMQRTPNGQLRRLWQIGSEHPVPEPIIPEVVHQFEQASSESLLNNSISKRGNFYNQGAYLMGEYQKVIKGRSNIEGYYRAFLERFQVNQYHKQRVELLNLGNWMVETGTFEMDITHKESSVRKAYEGKYQNLWRKDKNGDWKVFAEAWNYNHLVDDWGQFSFSELPLFDHLSVEVKDVPLQVLGLNKIAEEIIADHDAEKWIQLYDQQAMLLYSHSPLYNGKTAIEKHLHEHVKTLPIFNTLDIGTFFLEELDQYIIELGNHHTNWSHGESQGVSTGKNIRIWKKHKNGTIKIFRQTPMYDVN